jgi:hypothetical protein
LLEEKREEDSTAKGNKPVTWLEKFMGSMWGEE